MAASFSTIFPGHQWLGGAQLIRPRLIGNKAPSYWQQDPVLLATRRGLIYSSRSGSELTQRGGVI